VDRERDDGFEVIGDATDDESKPGVQYLDLGDEADMPENTPRLVPSWQRLGAVAGFFAVGLVAGAGVSDARSDALWATEQGQLSLVAGSVHGMVVSPVGAEGLVAASGAAVVPPGFHQLAVSLLNVGRSDVEVLSAHVAGWEGSDEAFAPQHIPAGEWVNVGMAFRPVCEAAAPQYLTAKVRADSRETTVAIPLPPGWDLIDSLHDEQCNVLEYDPKVDKITSFTTFEPGVRHMVLWVWLEDAAYVTQATVTQAGFRASGTEVLLPAIHGATTKLKLAWRIVDCADTGRLDELAVTLELTTAEGSVTRDVRLPHEAIAMLARFAAEECGP
jgi:hypothetical protein